MRLIPGDGARSVLAGVSVHSSLGMVSGGAHTHAENGGLLNAPFLLDESGVGQCTLEFSPRVVGTQVQCVRFSVPVLMDDGSQQTVWSEPSGPFTLRTNVSQFARTEAAVLQQLTFATEVIALPLASNLQKQTGPAHRLTADDRVAPLSQALAAVHEEVSALCDRERELSPADHRALALMMMAVSGQQMPTTTTAAAAGGALQPQPMVGARDWVLRFFEPFLGRSLRYLLHRCVRKLWSEQLILGFATRRGTAEMLQQRFGGQPGTFALVWLVAEHADEAAIPELTAAVLQRHG